MSFTNSPLVDYTKLSPNHSGKRTKKIDTITIHCVVGQLSVESIGNIFAPTSRQASSNYGVGEDGRVGMYVEEKNRSWCSSSESNDQRAVTIEVACDNKHPYAVKDKVMTSLIKLTADICKRNNIKELKWKNDAKLVGKVESQNMTLHKWVAPASSPTACPGEFLINAHGTIAKEVNLILNPPVEESGVLYRVQVGAYSSLSNAQAQEKKVKAKGFNTFLVTVDNLYKVQVGAFSKKANAEAQAKQVKAAGFDCFITTKSGSAVTGTPSTPSTPKVVKKGSKVKVKKGAKTYTNGGVASFVYDKVYVVDELKGDRALLDAKGLCTPFKVKDLIVQ